MIHRKKNRPALQRRDNLTVSSFFYIFFFLMRNLLNSYTTKSLVVLFFFSILHSSVLFKTLVFRSLSTHLFFLVVLLPLLLSMIAFSYVGLLSLL